jgi:ribosomal protein S11
VLIKKKEVLYSQIFIRYFSSKDKNLSGFKVKKIPKKNNIPLVPSQFITLLIKVTKRNIFSSVSDYNNKLLISLSIGILQVRGKERNTNYAIESTASLLCEKLTDLDKAYIICFFLGKSNLRKKRRFLKALRDQTPMHILKIQRFSLRSHNGCRPTKARRL